MNLKNDKKKILLTLSGRAAAHSGQCLGLKNASRPLSADNTTNAYGSVANKKHTKVISVFPPNMI